MIILGLSCFYHDSAAAIIKDGKIIAAAQEERFSRIKHDNNFPYKSIEYCLNSLRIAFNEVDLVVFYEKPILKFDRILNQHIKNFPRSINIFSKTIPSWINEKLQIKKILKEKCFYKGKIVFIDHHLSHAAASFFTSPFKKAAILTIDGVGEWATTTKGLGKGNRIELKEKIDFPDSLGLFYSALTSYLGFAVNNDEYKVMGLAAYGDPKPYFNKIKELVNFKNGNFKLDMKYFSFEYREKMFTKKLCELLDGPERKVDGKMTSRYKNIAASVQLVLEECVFEILNDLYSEYKCENLVLSGGVVLNSVMNGKILKSTPFKNLFVVSDPGDGGGALGAALYAYYDILENKKENDCFSPYLGPEFCYGEILEALNKFGLKHEYWNNESIFLNKVSELLINQKVVGWFQGKMEWGPRALGNRSILAAANNKEMRDIINKKVKHRESFRPFAPAILKEKLFDYFIADKNLPISTDYMLMVYPFKDKVKSKVPAVVHVDGTGRLQTIDQKNNRLFYDLINSYSNKTNIPLILNTSFNVKGEPIVCTPEDAIKCFLNTEIDYLVIGRFIISKINYGGNV